MAPSLIPKFAPHDHPTAAQRFVQDALHFTMSLGGEIGGVITAAPGYLLEVARNGLYPSGMTFRKLKHDPQAADLETLRRNNPDWDFRPGYNPQQWVLVFLHGYIDNTGADRIAYKLAEMGYQIYVVRYPFLRSVEELAHDLAAILTQIAEREPNAKLIPIGHSLGGFIWDELLQSQPDVALRYGMPLYIPLGSPHFGTLAAYLGVGESARQMQPISQVVRNHLQRPFPLGLEIYPFVSRYDMLVLPIETALVKEGVNYILSETGHVAQIIRDEIAVAIEEILASPADTLRDRASKRAFYPSSLMSILRALPQPVQRRLGIQGSMEYVLGSNGERPEFLLRIVHHEMHRETFPRLLRPGQL